MICSKCGKEFPDNNNFCVFCGSKAEEPKPKAEMEKPKKKTSTIVLAILCVLFFFGTCIFALLWSAAVDLYATYESIALEYMDGAVVIREGDDTYYHRFGCPTFPSEYTYHVDTVRGAVYDGYMECTDCGTEDAQYYVENIYEY